MKHINGVKLSPQKSMASLIQQVGNGVLIGMSGGAGTAISFQAPLWVQIAAGLAGGDFTGYMIYLREKKERC